VSSAPVHDPSRRAFLRGRRRIAAHRPPWALDESAFIDACTRCGDCVRACPEDVLRLDADGFPVVDFADGGCSFCGDCARACSALALDMQRGPRSRRHAVVGDECLTRSGIVCQSCRDECPEHAIRFPLLRAVAAPLLDADRCTGCGACVPACPARAIALSPWPDCNA